MKKIFAPKPLVFVLFFRALSFKYFPAFNEIGLQYVIDFYLILGFGIVLAKRIKNSRFWILSLFFIFFLLVILVNIFPDSDLGTASLYASIVIFLAELPIFIKVVRKKIQQDDPTRLEKIPFRAKKRTSFPTIDYFGLIKFSLVVILVLYLFNLQGTLDKSKEKIELLETKLGGAKKLSCNAQDAIEKAKYATVRIVGGESEGSGFFIDNEGNIVTNFHVIEFEPSPKVIYWDNTFENAEIVAVDVNSDLAFLKVEKDPYASLSFGESAGLESAEEIIALGYPFGGDLPGDASVIKGSLSGVRYSKDVGVEFLQTDSTLNPGMSGGPMINSCGEVVGVNTIGASGFGLAISSYSVSQKRIELMNSKTDPLQGISKVNIDPDKSALGAVEAFYNYLKIRRLEKAFELLSDNFKNGHGFNYWKEGYETLLDTTVIKIEEDLQKENRIEVKLTTKNMEEGEIVYKYFEGYWDVKEEDGKWKLWQANIKEIEEPDFYWFYE